MIRLLTIVVLLHSSAAFSCVKPTLIETAEGERLSEFQRLQTKCNRAMTLLRNGQAAMAVPDLEELVQSKEFLTVALDTALAEAMYQSGAPVEDTLVAWELVADGGDLKRARLFELVQRLPDSRAERLLKISPDRAAALALKKRAHADRLGVGSTLKVSSNGQSVAGRIGVLLPLTGATARFGLAVLRGIRAALKDETVLYVRDTAGKPDVAKHALKSLIGLGVTAIVGPINRNVTKMAAKECQEQAVPMLRLNLAPTDVASKVPWTFAAGFSRKSQSRAQVNYAMRRGWQRFAVVHTDNSYGRAVASEFSDAVLAAGGTLVHSVSYASKEQSLTSVAKELRAHEFDVLFVAESRNRAGRVLRFIAREDIWTAGVKEKVVANGDVRYVQVMAPSEWMDAAISKDDTRYFQGVLVASEWPGSSASAMKALLEPSMRMFGKRPGKFEAMGFDAISILQTIAGSTRQAMRKELLRGKGFHGLLGWCRFTESGELQRAVKLYRATKNTFTLVAAKRGRN